jgi:hypothetical protein
MFSGGSLTPNDVNQLRAARTQVGTVFGYRDCRFSIRISLLLSIDGVAERDGRTTVDDGNDFLSRGSVRVNPRLLLQPKDRRNAIAAQAGVGADPTVIVYSNPLAYIAVLPVVRATFQLVVGKANSGVGPITEWLIF